MIRSNSTSQTSHRRRAFRLALCVAIASNASVVLADTSCETMSQQVASVQLPEYPFPTASQATSGSPSASVKAIIRLLGFTGDKRTSLPNSGHVPHAVHLDGMSSLPILPSLPPVENNSPQTDVQVAPLGSLNSLAIASQSTVVAASAMRPAEAVHGSISDKSPNTEDLQQSSDLLSSLEDLLAPSVQAASSGPQNNGFSDSIQIDCPSESDNCTEDSAISMNFSDRTESTQSGANKTSVSTSTKVTGKSGPATSSTVVTDKAPQRLNTRQPMTLGAAGTTLRSELSSKPNQPSAGEKPREVLSTAPTAIASVGGLPKPERLPQRLQPSEGLAVLPQSSPMTKIEDTASDQNVAVSSRREAKPESLQNLLDSEPNTSTPSPRQPLVPILASAIGRAKLPEQVGMQEPELSPSLLQAAAPAVSNTAAIQRTLTQAIVQVAVKDSIALHSAEAIHKLSVEHADVCQVIQSGTKSFSVVGLQPGETRVAVISEKDGQRIVQIHQVVVGSTQNVGLNTSSVASEISQTIQQLFPRSKVRIATRGSQLVVSGHAESEEAAKKILSLVRKTTLTPVVDELKTK